MDRPWQRTYEKGVPGDIAYPEGMVVPAGSRVMGAPAKVRRAVTDEERASLRRYAERYVGLKEDYRSAAEA